MSDPSHLGKQRDRAVVSAAVSAIGSRAITTVTTVLTLAVVAHALTKPEFGVVGVLTTLVVFLGFADFGLGTLLLTRLPAARAAGVPGAERELVTTTTSALVLAGSVIAVLGTISAFVLPWTTLLGAHELATGDVRAAVMCFFALGGLAVPSNLGARVLGAVQQAYLVYVWNAVAGVLTLLAAGGCAVLDAPAWTYVLVITGVPTVASAVQTVWVFTRRLPHLCPPTLIVPWRTLWAMLRSAGYFAVISVSAVVAFNLDSVVVSSVLGAAQAAVFVVAARLFILVTGTLGIAGQQMWSALADALARGDAAWARSRYWRALGASLVASAGMSLVLVVGGRLFARIWVGHSLVPPISLLIMLGVYTVLSTCLNQASYLLAAVEEVRLLAFAGIVMAPVNLVLSIWFTHWIGLSGPALGSIVALVVTIGPPVVLVSNRLLRGFGAPVAAGAHAAEDAVRPDAAATS